MKTKNIEGIILSRTNFGEADRILTVFSREDGKVRILAKGARKIKSKLAPHIEPFSMGKYYLVPGKSFYILTGAEVIDQNSKITTDLDLFRDASYVSELLSMTIFEEVPAPNLYQITNTVFEKLPEYAPQTREVILRYFEFKLLESAGYVPNFYHCTDCGGEITEADWYEGNFEGVKCDNCGTKEKKVSKNFVKVIRYFAANDLNAVLKIKGIESVNKELRTVQQPFLYDILPRTPKAREI